MDVPTTCSVCGGAYVTKCEEYNDQGIHYDLFE